MSNWGFLENILSGVNKYSTVIGRICLSIIIFRILVYVAAAEHVWKDENKDFVCNIQQPGCENLIMVSTPSLLVPLHVAYRENRERRHGKLYEDKGRIDRGLLCTYIISLVFKTTFEVGSLLAFYFLYSGFDVPRLLRCSLDSCPNTVDCFGGGLYIMACTSIFCIVLNVSEMVYILSKQCWKCFSKHYIAIEERASRIIYLLITFGIMFMLKSKIQPLCFHFQC
uniref:Gap junction protein beta 7 n=1 Tax=Salmo trutta TaxID=8032 RepID=A0A674E6W3_SALTR